MFAKINRRYRRFKFIFFFSLVILILIPVFFTIYQMGFFSSVPKIKTENHYSENSPVLKVVANYDFCPRSFYDENNQISGLDIEVVNIIANELGYKLDIEFYDWPTCKKKMLNGEADLLLGLEIYSEMVGVSKTIPISYDHISVYGKESVFTVSSLSNKKVGLMANSIIKDLFDLNCEYVEYYTNTEILEAIESGEVDFGVCHNAIANKIIKNEKLNVEPGFTLMESYPAIGVRADKPNLVYDIDKVIKNLGEAGTLKKLEVKWIERFSSIKSFSAVFNKYEYFYIFYYIIALIYCFLMAFILIYVKTQIKIKKHIDILSSVAEIYMSMHYVNLKTDSVEESLSGNENINKIINLEDSASNKMIKIMTTQVVPSDVEKVLTFTDLSTLPNRLGDKKSISADFVGKNVGWFRCQFIAVTYDDNNVVQSVIFTTQVINDEKKREEELIYLSSVDELTRLFNRRAYEVDAAGENKKLSEDFVYISFDLNGLKRLNDSKGHAAGDELLQGAAESLSMVFNPYGKVYRMGGDEFSAMLHGDAETVVDLMDTLEKILKRWNGTYVKEISISSGIVMAKDYPGKTVEELSQIADDLMYKAKEEYYKKTGNRR